MKEISNVNQLCENEELMNALDDVTNAQELATVLEHFGIKLEDGLTAEQAYECFSKGKMHNDEINEDELESVAGGFGFGAALALGAAIIIGGQVMEYHGYRLSKKAFCRR